MTIFDEIVGEGLRLDTSDPLHCFRNEFAIPRDIVYFVGHSLGLRSRAAARCSDEAVRQWETLGVESWFDPQPESPLGPWLKLEERTGRLLAPLLGANPLDLAIMSGLGVNLIMLLHSLYRPQGSKRKIALARSGFPQDRWLVEQHLALPAHSSEDLLWFSIPPDERMFREEDLVSMLDEHGSEVSVLLLELVSYITGQLLDIAPIMEAARRNDVVVILDLSHSAFILPHALNLWGVDAAVGCSYKFGCSGPGGIGFLYVNERHWSNENTWRPGGWWGNARQTQFEMGPRWDPSPGAAAWQISTIPVLTAAPFLGSLELFHKVGIEPIREKSLRMTDFAMQSLELLRNQLLPFRVITPLEATRRGSELVLEFVDGTAARTLKERLREKGFLVDFRSSPFSDAPKAGILRAGFHPLFNTFEEVARFCTLLCELPNNALP